MSGGSISKVKEEGPSSARFLEELYGEDAYEEKPMVESQWADMEEDDVEYEFKYVTPPHLPVSSHERRAGGSPPTGFHFGSRPRSRSRSPLNARSQSSEICPRPSYTQTCWKDEDGEEYLVIVDEGGQWKSETHNKEAIYDPTVDAKFADVNAANGDVLGQELGGEARPVGDQQIQWVVGNPLREMWTTDNDVPLGMRQTARNMVMRGQVKHESVPKSSTVDEGIKSEITGGDECYQDVSGGTDLTPQDEDLQFEWINTPFTGHEEIFKPQRIGSVKKHATAYDAFRSFWDDSILQHLVNAINLYADKVTTKHFQSTWYSTNIHEMLCLFMFWLMLGIIRMPTILSCFSSNPLLKVDVFQQLFTRDRYKALVRALQFLNEDPVVHSPHPTTASSSASWDRLHHLKPIIKHLNAKFQENYVPSKDVRIDKNRSLCKDHQTVRSNAGEYEIKSFELSECSTGYVYSFIVQPGKQASVDVVEVVHELIGPLLDNGYRLFVDIGFSSLLLARFLKRNGTDCVGPVTSYNKDVPFLIAHGPLERGQITTRHCGDICLLAWHDMKRVMMMSTCHGNATVLTHVFTRAGRSLAYKPQVSQDYKKCMGEGDLKEQPLDAYLVERKQTTEWYLKLFKQLINCSILNARILFQSSLNNRQDHLAFGLQLVESIISKHHHLMPAKSLRRVGPPKLPLRSEPTKIDCNHWPVFLENPGEATNRQYRARCVMCARDKRKDQKTPYQCDTCLVPLCAVYCFKKFHSTIS